jgi:hypothetical protein
MPFVAGKSGNPSGRPKGFAGVARKIMSETRDGDELVEFALSVWRDTKRTMQERMEAHAWLSDRALGKALATHDVTTHGEGELDLDGLSYADLRRMLDEDEAAEAKRRDTNPSAHEQSRDVSSSTAVANGSTNHRSSTEQALTCAGGEQ